jgi:hypothetical protein
LSEYQGGLEEVPLEQGQEELVLEPEELVLEPEEVAS